MAEHLLPRYVLNSRHIRCERSKILYSAAPMTYEYYHVGYSYIFNRFEVMVHRTSAGAGGNLAGEVILNNYFLGRLHSSDLFNSVAWVDAGTNNALVILKWGDYCSHRGNYLSSDRNYAQNYMETSKMQGFRIAVRSNVQNIYYDIIIDCYRDHE